MKLSGILLAGILFVLFSCPMAFAQEVSSLGKLGKERVDSVKKMVVDTAKLDYYISVPTPRHGQPEAGG